MVIKQLEIDGVIIDVEKKKVKNMRLVVSAEKIRVSAPMRTSFEEIKNFVTSKIEWIKKHQNKFIIREKIADNAIDMLSPMKEVYHFQGVAYILRIIKSDVQPNVILTTEFVDGETKKYFNLYVKPSMDTTLYPAIINYWYKIQLEVTAKPLIEKWEAIIGVKSNEFRVKNMRTRWGTCNIRDKRIWLSLALIKKVASLLRIRDCSRACASFGKAT